MWCYTTKREHEAYKVAILHKKVACAHALVRTVKFSSSTAGSVSQRFSKEESGALHLSFWSKFYDK